MKSKTYDFVVIGSGASGGVLAAELHRGGAKCLLIEAGKHFRKDTFPRSEMAYSAQMYWGGGLEFDRKASTAFLRGKCVGGTTVLNQALMNRFDEGAWADWRSRSGVDFFATDAMEAHYVALESRMTMQTYHAADSNENANIFTRGCDRLGIPWKFLRRGFSDCQTAKGNDCITCLGGCHRDSKQSALVAFIHPAEASGLEILSEFEVERVEERNGGVSVFGRGPAGAVEIASKQVVLAGGSFGTTGLLLRSGFGGKLPALGEGFSQHPQYMSFGLYDKPVDAHQGAFQTVASADPAYRKLGYKLENVYAGPISIGMLLNAHGKEHQTLMRNYRNFACIEAAVRDDSRGSIKLDKKGRLEVSKNLNATDLSRRDAGLAAIQEIMEASGAKQVIHSPYFFGLHLMGGSAIGTDAKTAVVDPIFRVHGTQSIYAADSSIFPEAPGINPSFTIMALSHRLSQQLLKS